MGSDNIKAMIKTCAVVLLLVLVGSHSSEAEEPTFLGFKNSQQCQCECECPTPGDSKCMCDCECPRPGSSCGPGFTQVCPSPDGTCPENFMPLCPEDLTAAGRADTPMVQNREEEVVTVDVDAFTCSKKSIACSIVVTFAEDCTSTTSAKPTCRQKNSQCQNRPLQLTPTTPPPPPLPQPPRLQQEQEETTIANVSRTSCCTWASWPWEGQVLGSHLWGPASVLLG